MATISICPLKMLPIVYAHRQRLVTQTARASKTIAARLVMVPANPYESELRAYEGDENNRLAVKPWWKECQRRARKKRTAHWPTVMLDLRSARMRT